METQGVLIIDTGEIVGQDGTSYDPAKNIAQAGDYIVAFNDQRVTSKKELVEDIACCQGETATLSVIRHGEEIPICLEPVMGEDGCYKLGIWVRDNTQGIGTLTYVRAVSYTHLDVYKRQVFCSVSGGNQAVEILQWKDRPGGEEDASDR